MYRLTTVHLYGKGIHIVNDEVRRPANKNNAATLTRMRRCYNDSESIDVYNALPDGRAFNLFGRTKKKNIEQHVCE